MSTTFAFKGSVATKPFDRQGAHLLTKSGFGTHDHKARLVGLEVVFADPETSISPGDTVWVRPDGERSFGKDSVEAAGETVIVFPVAHVLLVTKNR